MKKNYVITCNLNIEPPSITTMCNTQILLLKKIIIIFKNNIVWGEKVFLPTNKIYVGLGA